MFTVTFFCPIDIRESKTALVQVPSASFLDFFFFWEIHGTSELPVGSVTHPTFYSLWAGNKTKPLSLSEYSVYDNGNLAFFFYYYYYSDYRYPLLDDE